MLERNEGLLSGVGRYSYESSSEMEACGCRVPYRTLAYLIACRQVVVGVGVGVSFGYTCSLISCLMSNPII